MQLNSMRLLLKQSILFLGGLTTAEGGVSDNSMIMLDILSNSEITADELKDKWATVTTYTNGLNIQPRDVPQTMQLPDGKTLLLRGGCNTASSKLAYQTISFNAESHSWEGYANYAEGAYRNRQM
jgi:hypothetical protein